MSPRCVIDWPCFSRRTPCGRPASQIFFDENAMSMDSMSGEVGFGGSIEVGVETGFIVDCWEGPPLTFE